jgi:hypothetical protein
MTNLLKDYYYQGNFIKVFNSTFRHLNYGSRPITKPTLVSRDLGMQYQGLAITLNAFNGQVIVSNSSFSNNVFKFESCEILPQADDPYLPLELNSTLFNPLNSSDISTLNRNNGSSFDKLQIKGVIAVLNHSSNALQISDSTFENNTGTKGIVTLEVGLGSLRAVLVHGNTFKRNSALFDANVVEVRKRATQVLRPRFGDSTDMQCGGIQLSNNLFEQNVGCRNTHGAVNLVCLDHSGNATTIKQVQLTDSQYFNGTMYDGNLTLYDPNALPEIQNDFGSDTTTGFYLRDYEELIQNGFQPGESIFVRVNNFRLVMIGNVYLQNYAGNKRSIVNVQGFPVVWNNNETYRDNENWFPEAFNQLSIVGNASAPAKAYRESDLVAYPYKALSPLVIWRALYVRFERSTFDNNYVVDDTSPELHDAYH